MQLSNRSLEWLVGDRYRWAQHAIFWLFMYLPHLLQIFGITGKSPSLAVSLTYMAVLMVDMSLVYVNLYIFIPRFFLKRRYWDYLLATFGLIGFNALFGTLLLPYFQSGAWNFVLKEFVIGFVLTANVLGTAIGFNIIKRFLRAQSRLKELETTTLRTELSYLKNQINPHFLFNSLNNIYVQSRIAPTEASESILQLSDLLRYQLYDCAKDKVNLDDEIEYLENYLKIDKLRKSRADVDFHVAGSPLGIKVAPFLFIPFVENALKHGISLENESFIKVNFDIQPGEIVFEIANSKPQQPVVANIKGGIGLANISRRLDLLYPDRYRLDIDNQKDRYRVRMQIHLN